MWRCPKCNRKFKVKNQWHSCTNQDIDALFENKPDNLVLVLDKILSITESWQDNEVGVAKKQFGV